MIELYSGTPGSGKSYHAAERIYYSLRSGRMNVICNFDFCVPTKHCKIRSSLDCVSNSELTVDFLISYCNQFHEPMKEGQTLVVIDEAGIKFNSRDWNNKDRFDWLDFFSQHRKFGFDVILIAQSDIMIDKQIRTFIELECRHRKISAMGWKSFIIRPFGTFIDIESYYSNKVKLRVKYIRYHKKIAKMYNSFNLFNSYE